MLRYAALLLLEVKRRTSLLPPLVHAFLLFYDPPLTPKLGTGFYVLQLFKTIGQSG